MWHEAIALIDRCIRCAEQLHGLEGPPTAELLCHSQLRTRAELALGVGSQHWAHEQEVCSSYENVFENASVVRWAEEMYK
jgi:uncharacterized protein YecA (UPF0149 family)